MLDLVMRFPGTTSRLCADTSNSDTVDILAPILTSQHHTFNVGLRYCNDQIVAERNIEHEDNFRANHGANSTTDRCKGCEHILFCVGEGA